MKYEFIEENKSEVCEKILRSLPEWFGIESAILDYIKDVQQMLMLVAKSDSEVIGFLALNHHNKYTAEIHVMGVLSQFHRKKVGQQLVAEAEAHLRAKGYQFLTVKTLSEHNPCLFMVKMFPL